MPNESDKNEKTAVTPAAAAPPPDQPAPAPGGKKKLHLFGGIGLAAVVVGIVLALGVVKPMLAPSPETPAGAAESAAPAPHAETAPAETRKESGGGHGGGADAARIFTIDDLVINPAGTGGSRFLSVSIGFEVKTEAAMIAFRAREPAIRDALITILSSKTVAQLTDTRQKEITRYQIKKRVGELMKTDELAGVYYTDFVLQ